MTHVHEDFRCSCRDSRRRRGAWVSLQTATRNWGPRPVRQWQGRVWPGWDHNPWPRSVWSGLSRSMNSLSWTRAAFARRAASQCGPGALGDACVGPSLPLGAFRRFGQAHESTLRLVERAGQVIGDKITTRGAEALSGNRGGCRSTPLS